MNIKNVSNSWLALLVFITSCDSNDNTENFTLQGDWQLATIEISTDDAQQEFTLPTNYRVVAKFADNGTYTTGNHPTPLTYSWGKAESVLKMEVPDQGEMSFPMTHGTDGTWSYEVVDIQLQNGTELSEADQQIVGYISTLLLPSQKELTSTTTLKVRFKMKKA